MQFKVLSRFGGILLESLTNANTFGNVMNKTNYVAKQLCLRPDDHPLKSIYKVIKVTESLRFLLIVTL